MAKFHYGREQNFIMEDMMNKTHRNHSLVLILPYPGVYMPKNHLQMFMGFHLPN